MFIGIQKRRCLHCGHKFSHILGGIVYQPYPPCPVCGSRFTIKAQLLP